MKSFLLALATVALFAVAAAGSSSTDSAQGSCPETQSCCGACCGTCK